MGQEMIIRKRSYNYYEYSYLVTLLHVCIMKFDDYLRNFLQKDRKKLVQYHQYTPKICDAEVSNDSVYTVHKHNLVIYGVINC